MTTAAARPVFCAPDLEVAASLSVLAPELARAEPLLARHLRRGTWRRYGRVVVTHNGPLTSEQGLWVALLRSPAGTVLAGATAARRQGLRVDEPEVPRLLVPYGAPRPDLQGVSVRRTRVLTQRDVHPVLQPPTLRLARAVLDEAARTARPADVRALLCATVQQRLLRPADLRSVLLRLGPQTGRALVLEVLGEVELGVHSRREGQFLGMVRGARLPEPRLQVARRAGTGVRYLDGLWEDYDLHAEIDGAGHLAVAQWSADCLRANELELGPGRERHLRFPGFWLDEQPQRVLEQVERGLRLGGWTG